jgi:hypothetical protein
MILKQSGRDKDIVIQEKICMIVTKMIALNFLKKNTANLLIFVSSLRDFYLLMIGCYQHCVPNRT